MTDDSTVPQDDSSEPHKPAEIEPKPKQTRGVFLPLVFGGAVATALGFVAAQNETLEDALGLSGFQQETQVDPTVLAELSALRDTLSAQTALLDAQADKITELETRVEDVAAPVLPETDSDLIERLSQLEAQFEGLSSAGQTTVAEGASAVSQDEIVALRSEIEGIRSDLSSVSVEPDDATIQNLVEAALRDFEARFAELEAGILSQSEELASLVQSSKDAEERARVDRDAARTRDVVSQLRAAVETGGSLTEALAAVDPDVLPPELAGEVPDEIATLAQLQGEFPDAARAALAASRAASDDPGGIGTFFQEQFQLRSVTPKEGDDPDAILSRAEASIMAGDVSDALNELDGLPNAGKTAMEDWLERARLRSSSLAAIDSVLTDLEAK